jgi:23S rRNA pseudouridine2604 synthase
MKVREIPKWRFLFLIGFLEAKGWGEKVEQQMRLNKWLSEAGVCSRREADRRIEAGQVLVNGVKAQMGMRVSPQDDIYYLGKRVEKKEGMVLLLFHKPRGIVCTAEKREKNNIVDYLDYPTRIYPVGRLDKDSEGLILMTNQGSLVNRIMRAGNYHEKEYIVQVDKEITADFIRQMSTGIPILDTITRPCKVHKVDRYTFRIILTQGLNRQIRRMCEYLGYQVHRLKRERIMNLTLTGISLGKYRMVTQEELGELAGLLEGATSLPWSEQREFDQKRGN